jgi:hypothetical protein
MRITLIKTVSLNGFVKNSAVPAFIALTELGIAVASDEYDLVEVSPAIRS